MNKDWIDKLSKRMDSHQMAPPESLWSRLEQNIADRQKAIDKRRHRFYYLKSVCAAAAVIAVVSIAVYRLASSVQDQVSAAIDTLPYKQPPVARPLMAGNTKPVPSVPTVPTLRKPAASVEIVDTLLPGAVSKAVPAMQPKAKAQAGKRQPKQVSRKVGQLMEKNTIHDEGKNIAPIVKKGHRLVGSLYASSLGTSAQACAPTVGYKYPYYTGMVMGSRKNVKMHHQMPIRVGLSLSYALNRNWAIETGVSYSCLRSDYNERDYFYDQTLHYVGVPLRIVYNVWSYRRFSLYAAGGGMLEKCVAGKAKEGYADGKSPELRYSLEEKRWQWSVNASVGLQYKLAGFAGIYVEPGVSHYFDNASSLSNIYKDSPTRFSLQIGLRFMP